MTVQPSGLVPGNVIDGYVLGQRLHQGGMASLWDITPADGRDEGPLIMKVPRFKGGEDPASIVGFEVEQMIMPMLSGLHVPRFVGKGDFTRLPYIVMERINGPSLRARLDAAPLPIDDIAAIARKVALALHDLHRQQVTHLDVKPSNILFRPTGQAVLIDFGLSRHAQLPDLLEEEFSLPMGTGPYMSPEQVQFVRGDPRSDLFALGVMLYHLTTGERPFGNPQTVAGLRKRLYTEAVPPRALRPDTPPWLQEVILRCLEVDPDARYQTGAQLALDVQQQDALQLTERAHRTAVAGRIATMKRWFKAVGSEAKPSGTLDELVERSPIVMAAVDVDGAAPELNRKLLATVRRILRIEPGARLACVSVMKLRRVGMDKLTDDEGRSIHVKALVAIKHWARPLQQELGLDEQRLTFHVLEAPDAAHAIVDFASRNGVDHIVMGARGSSALRRYLGSVSAQVVAQAPCSVTVVRA